MPSERNRAEQREAHALATELDIKYTHALRLIRTVRVLYPAARGLVLRNKCRDLMAVRDA